MYDADLPITDEVTEAERDEYLRLFSHQPAVPGEATRWLQQWMRETKMKQPEIEELPEFEEMFKKTFDKVRREQLAKFSPSERVEGLAPEQVLGTLSSEQLLPALPLDVLRGLSDDYLRSLPPEVQEQIAMRLQIPTH